ncbi:MAG: cutinase family protein [Mycobacterium sp.]
MMSSGVRRIGGIGIVAASALLSAPFGVPTASADPCPSVQVVYARGTNEAPGLGLVGQVFTDTLSAQLPGRSVAVYPVNYPASDDYLKSAAAGSDDARAQIQETVANCPSTKVVLGGYSQGAAVTELVTAQLPPQVADHVAAVALFGVPSSDFSKMLAGGAVLPTVNPTYAAKTIDLCLTDDPICSAGANMMAHVSYVPSGMVSQAATFAASKIDQAPR